MGAVATAVAAGLIGSLGAAQAEAKSVVYPSVEFNGSNVFSVFVYGQPDGGVTVNVNKKDAFASYTTKGKISGKQIKADLKSFGKVKLKFKPKGKPETVKPPKGCKGASSKFQEGTWEGKFTFKGEGGYTKVSAKSGKGSVSTRPAVPPKCDDPPDNPNNPKPCVFVFAESKVAGGSVMFNGSKAEGKSAQFFAYYDGSQNGVELSKSASADGGTLTVNADAGTGTVAPGSPFTGSGTFADNQLSGNLEVEMPGLKAKLAGEGSVSEGTCY